MDHSGNFCLTVGVACVVGVAKTTGVYMGVVMRRTMCVDVVRWKFRLSLLCQSQEDVLHQHGANHHLLAVDRQHSPTFLFGRHSDQHQAATGHCPAGEPVDRKFRKKRSTEVIAAEQEVEMKVRMKRTGESGGHMTNATAD